MMYAINPLSYSIMNTSDVPLPFLFSFARIIAYNDSKILIVKISKPDT